jgi:DNA repair exonuclease SbcCD ATPase subunit
MRTMNEEFTIKSEDRYKELEVRRVNSGEDGEDDEYSLEVRLYDDLLPFWFDSEAQAKEFVEKFAALIEGFEVEQVTKRIRNLERDLKDAQAKIEELRAKLKEGRQTLDEAVSERNQALELSIGYEAQRNEANRRADRIEAALADRIEHCEKYHSGSAIVKTLTNQHGQPFAVYLSDGMKIGIERDGGAAWLRIEPTPIVREAGEGGKSE